jgi:ubiquinone/menaquinone biosynthesis C-methylase UbiE
MGTKIHWETIHQTKSPQQVSWYQDHPTLSLEFIQRTRVEPASPIIDIGGGISTLADHLLEAGYSNLTVLDISAAALETARQRLSTRAAGVNWIEADITQINLPADAFDIWHDRAVFHFLIQPEARQRYIETARRAVKKGGHVIIATFASDGPPQCSGLDVRRYSPESLQEEFGAGFQLVDSAQEVHRTPFSTEQKFTYCYFRLR